ncbi:hypothetical protein ABM187_002891 [Stenotrophomonas maltophilia]|uniref:hypothetical protein n=1 Tax=Stenotrophomonas maltophilia TaxID=40324 RepID=UPI001FA6DB5C|nr:hypothetical protein [Stenotrophomonas maltophilia]HEL2984285.1 hypothetical protein [Stenotrophomonas maltophilia]
MEWAFTGVTLFLGVLGLVLTVLWIFVPFAIFGIKPLLQEILRELRKANAVAEANTPPVSPAAATEGEEPRGALATIRAAVRQADRS